MEQRYDGRWQKFTLPNLPHLQESAAAVIDNKIYFFGGETRIAGHGSECDTLWCFDTELCVFEICNLIQYSQTFQEVQTSNKKPPKRACHTMVSFGNSLYVFGGKQESQYYNDIWTINLSSLQWTQLIPSGTKPPPTIAWHAAISNSKNDQI
jgi:N-acetylneuraminic acid mutarotase